MKRFILCCILSAYTLALTAQNGVAINTDNSNPNPSAILDVKSTNKGILVPRVALTSISDITTIATPAISLLIYNTSTTTDLIPGFYYFNGTNWTPIKQTAWNLAGNVGTVSGTNFIGTIDSQAIDFRTHNVIKARLTTKGQLEILNTGQSIFIGEGAGNNDDLSNNFNSFIGFRAGYHTTTGSNNTATGRSALFSNTTGYNNTANGDRVLFSTTTGYNNTANGYEALFSNTTGYNNTVNGYNSLALNTTGSNNTTTGVLTLYSNTTGFNNTAIGDHVLFSNTTGFSNAAIGGGALFNNVAGSNNTALGALAGYNSVGSSNVFLGTQAGYNEAGSNKLYIDNTSTSSPLIYGDFANNLLRINGTFNINNNYSLPTTDGTTGQVLTTNGSGSVSWSTATSGWNITGNTGTLSGTNFIGTIDSQAIDFRTNNTIKTRLTPKGQLEFLNTGRSIFIGERAGSNDDLSTNDNVLIGFDAGTSTTTGNGNTAVGSFSLRSNTTGLYNTAIGNSALYYNTIGRYNIANGVDALRNNTTGNGNTAIGYVTLLNNTTGIDNTAIGNSAFILGTNYSNSTALGYATNITASNQIRLGNNTVSSIGGAANWTNVSDARFKTHIKENVVGLDFINQLRPVTYYLDMDAIAKFQHIPDSLRSLEAEAIKAQILQTGFIAQEVEQAAQQLGYDFSGIDAPKNESDHYGLRYAEFTVPLVKAVQELAQENESLKNNQKATNKQLQDLQQQLQLLQTQLKELTKHN